MPTNSEVTAFVAAQLTAGYTVTAGETTALDTYVSAAKTHSYWSGMQLVCPWIGSTIAQKLIPLQAVSPFVTPLTNHGLTALNIRSDGGLQGDGANYITTGVNISALNDVTGGMAFFLSADAPSVTASTEWLAGCGQSGSPQIAFSIGNTGGNAYGVWGGSATCATPASTVTPAALHQVSRTSTTNIVYYANGRKVTTVVTAVTTVGGRSSAFNILAGNNGGLPTTKSCGYFSVDTGTFTDAQVLNHAADVNALLIGIGRIAPPNQPLKLAMVTGQSLAIGAGSALVNTSPFVSYTNRMTPGGMQPFPPTVYPPAGAYDAVLSPLYEGKTPAGETVATIMAASISSMWRTGNPGDTSQDLVFGNWGVSGTAYSGLKQGTNPYNDSVLWITDLTNGASLYSSSAQKTVVTAIPQLHGEADSQSATYAADLKTWHDNYNTDIKAVTGQTQNIPLIISQCFGYTSAAGGNQTTILSDLAMLAAYRANPNDIILAMPKYICTYQADGLHIIGTSEDLVAEYYAKFYWKNVILGTPAAGLCPSRVYRVGAVVHIEYANRIGDLALDTSVVSNPGNYGFEFYAGTGGNTPTISSVALEGNNTRVAITLSATPTGTNPAIRYAYTGTAGALGGPTTGPRGCLRDTDTSYPSILGNNLFNYGLQFNDVITVDVAAPTVTSSTVASNGINTVIVFSEPMSTAGSAGSWTVGGFTASGISLATDGLSATLTHAQIFQGATVVTNYTQGTAADLSGNLLATFTNQATTNNSTASASPVTTAPTVTVTLVGGIPRITRGMVANAANYKLWREVPAGTLTLLSSAMGTTFDDSGYTGAVPVSYKVVGTNGNFGDGPVGTASFGSGGGTGLASYTWNTLTLVPSGPNGQNLTVSAPPTLPTDAVLSSENGIIYYTDVNGARQSVSVQAGLAQPVRANAILPDGLPAGITISVGYVAT